MPARHLCAIHFNDQCLIGILQTLTPAYINTYVAQSGTPVDFFWVHPARAD